MRWTRGRIGGAAPPARGERFEEVAAAGGAVVEVVTSSAAPDAREQRQDHDEWAAVVHGSAELEIDGVPVTLAAGEWVLLPAGTPHRVLATDAGTVWVTVHLPRS